MVQDPPTVKALPQLLVWINGAATEIALMESVEFPVLASTNGCGTEKLGIPTVVFAYVKDDGLSVAVVELNVAPVRVEV